MAENKPVSIKSHPEFQSFIKTHEGHLAVVMFVEDWSESCAAMYSTLLEIMNDAYASPQNVAFCEVIAESNPEICQAHRIEGVPTVVFFRKMKEIDRVSGARVREVATKLKFLAKDEIAPQIEPTNMSAVHDLNKRLEELINRKGVMLFMKGTPSSPQCGFSRTIVGILNETGVPYGTFNILEDEIVRQGLKTYSNWQTYPQLYAKGELIGGLDIIKELKENGDLESTLKGSS